MYLSEIHIIKKSHTCWKQVDEALFASKNLYNRANFIVRQEFINTTKLKEQGLLQTAKYLNYNAVNRLLIDSQDPDYIKLPRKVSNQILIGLDRNWKSYFKAIKDWKTNKGKYTGQPKLPKYKHKTNGRNMLTFDKQAISKNSLQKGLIKPSGIDFEIPFVNKGSKLIEVRIKPANNLNIEIHIIYERVEKQLKTEEARNILGIDLGIHNLMTLTSNSKGHRPLIINGRPLNSINQYYSKKLAKYKSELPFGYRQVWNKETKLLETKLVQTSTSKSIKILTRKRNAKVKDYLHKASKLVVDHCIANNIDTIVIGRNKQWKTEVSMGNANNQNFCTIPHSTLIHMLEYKGKLEGLRVVVREESYTSVSSFFDNDKLPTYGEEGQEYVVFSGKRLKRGLYQTKTGRLINADVNGSLNILRKEFPDAFGPEGIEGVVVHPRRVKVSY